MEDNKAKRNQTNKHDLVTRPKVTSTQRVHELEEDAKNHPIADMELLNAREASSFLSISESMLRAWVFRRKIPLIRIGRCLRFNKADLQVWLNGKKFASTEEN